MLIEDLGNAAGLLDCEHELRALVGGTHGGIPHRARPDRGHQRAHLEVLAGNEVCHALDVIQAAIRVRVGMEEEEIHALELLPVHLRIGGEFEHALQADGRVVRAGLFADEAGPHRVVQFG